MGFPVRHKRFSLALTLTGLCGILITTPGLNQIFNALPLHNLLWPLRFLGIASTLLLLALVWRLEDLSQQAPWIAGLGIALLALDGTGSLSLIHLQSLRPDLLPISQALARLPGWREATLDQSTLGSGPSYLFTAIGKREQVFGWAYQGASTASDVAALNDAMQFGHLAYLTDRLNRMGVDDVVLWKGAPNAALTASTLLQAGFLPIFDGEISSLYHRDGSPRALQVQNTSPGDWASHTALCLSLSPNYGRRIEIPGGYTRFRSLKVTQLCCWPALPRGIEAAAENLIRQVAASGRRVLIDLTGVQRGPVSAHSAFSGCMGRTPGTGG